MNGVQKYDKVQFNLPIAESLLYHPCLEPLLGKIKIAKAVVYANCQKMLKDEYIKEYMV